MHIFLLNFLSGSILRVCFHCIVIVEDLVDDKKDTCAYNFLGLFALVSFNIDVILMQIDNFLAVYWNVKYKPRVSTKLAQKCCLAAKLISLVAVCCVALLDPSYGKCSSKIAFLNLRLANIYLDAYPKILIACILLGNSIYVGITIERLKKKVQPLVHLPSMPSVSRDVKENENRAVRTQRKILRKDDDPNMFYEVEIDFNGVDHVHIENRNDEGEMKMKFFKLNKEIISVAKASLTMNLLTAVLFTIIVPNRILHIIYQNCSSDCETYFCLESIISLLRIIFAILHPLLILKKLDQI